MFIVNEAVNSHINPRSIRVCSTVPGATMANWLNLFGCHGKVQHTALLASL